MKWLLIILLSASANSWTADSPPELWSWFKDLDKPKEACEIQSAFVLQKLKLQNQTENEYGIYGNIKSNRVVVKCIEISDKTSKLIVAVAGHHRDSVKLVRNEIIRLIN